VKSVDLPLGGLVQPEGRHCDLAGSTADLHDVSLPGRAHVGQNSACQANRGEQARSELFFDLRIGDLLDSAFDAHPGIVHQHVE